MMSGNSATPKQMYRVLCYELNDLHLHIRTHKYTSFGFIRTAKKAHEIKGIIFYLNFRASLLANTNNTHKVHYLSSTFI